MNECIILLSNVVNDLTKVNPVIPKRIGYCCYIDFIGSLSPTEASVFKVKNDVAIVSGVNGSRWFGALRKNALCQSDISARKASQDSLC